MSVRPALPQDTAACVDILRAWIDETPWMPMIHTRASMLSYWGDALQRGGWVFEDAGDILGFAQRDGDFLNALYLSREARRKGIGSRLLAEAAGSQQPLSLWTFQANVSAQAFYAHHRFQEVRRTDGDNEEGLPDILLRR